MLKKFSVCVFLLSSFWIGGSFSLIPDPAHAKLYIKKDALSRCGNYYKVQTRKGSIKIKKVRKDGKGLYFHLRDVIYE